MALFLFLVYQNPQNRDRCVRCITCSVVSVFATCLATCGLTGAVERMCTIERIHIPSECALSVTGALHSAHCRHSVKGGGLALPRAHRGTSVVLSLSQLEIAQANFSLNDVQSRSGVFSIQNLVCFHFLRSDCARSQWWNDKLVHAMS